MATSQGRGFADGIYVEEFDGQDPCLEIKTRLVDGADGRILATHDVYNRWRTFEDEEYLLSGLSQKYLEYFPIVQGSLLEINKKAFKIDLCIEDLIKQGMKVLVYRLMEENDYIMGEGRVKKVAKGYSSVCPTKDPASLIPEDLLKKLQVGDLVITK